MKAFLIDPSAQTITAVEYDGNYKSITKMIEAQMFTTVQINEEEDTIYLDDEGLFVEGQSFFMIAGYPEPLAGKGLVLGTDAEGDSDEPVITFDSLLDCVQFGYLYKEALSGTIQFAGAPARTAMVKNGSLK